MALAIVVCNAFINAGLPAFTGSYVFIYPFDTRQIYFHLKFLSIGKFNVICCHNFI